VITGAVAAVEVFSVAGGSVEKYGVADFSQLSGAFDEDGLKAFEDAVSLSAVFVHVAHPAESFVAHVVVEGLEYLLLRSDFDELSGLEVEHLLGVGVGRDGF
jgi:hypothetical protein